MRNFLWLLAFTFCAFFGEIRAEDYLTTDLLTQLYTWNDSSIVDMHEGKYYLNADRIHISQEGIFLESDYMGIVALSNLIQNYSGMYTVGAYYHYRCNGCGACYNYRPSECGSCGGTSFTYVDDLDEG